MYKRQVLDEVRVTGVKMIQKQVSDGDIETKINICRESEIIESEEREMHVSDESCLLYTSRCV